jgi:hypothetical protein
MKATEYREWGPDDPETADNGDIQMEYSTDLQCSPSIGAIKNYM